MQELILVQPTAEYAAQIRAYRQAFLDAGDSMDGTGSLRRRENSLDWLQDTADCTHPETVPAGWVTATQFLGVRPADNRIVGMIHVRHYFNDYLEKYGGHIGYSVHPAERRQGYAKEMLRLCLPYCRTLGLQKVLITCDADNAGSRRTILANGGVYESTVSQPEEQIPLERYWITL